MYIYIMYIYTLYIYMHKYKVGLRRDYLHKYDPLQRNICFA